MKLWVLLSVLLTILAVYALGGETEGEIAPHSVAVESESSQENIIQQSVVYNENRYAWGEALGGLRIGLLHIKPPKPSIRDKPSFTVTLENIGEKGLALNLGTMLANGKEQYATAVKLIFTDLDGKNYEFHNNFGRHAGIAGRLDPFVVPLPTGCSYVLSVNFDNHWFLPIGTSLPEGQYQISTPPLPASTQRQLR